LQTALIAIGLTWGLGAPLTASAEVFEAEITAKDGRLSPAVLTVPAGVKVRLTLRNEGQAAVEIENLPLRVEKILAPNGVAKVTLQPLEPGSYPFVDEFHAATGKMVLQVK
jgi:plastocyanin